MHAHRRTLLRSSVWAVPAVSVAVAAPAVACSPTWVYVLSANLRLRSTTTTSPANGHTVGTFTATICNNGTRAIPAGTVYVMSMEAEKSPNASSGSKDIAVTPRVSPLASVDPLGTATLNPDTPVYEQDYTLTFIAPLPIGACLDVVWDIATETGIGATKLLGTLALRAWGDTDCATSARTSQSMLSTRWGANAD